MNTLKNLEQQYFDKKINWSTFESKKESILNKFNNSFKTWLDTFIKEKDLNMEDSFEIEKEGNLNIFSYKSVYEYILISTPEEKKKIKKLFEQSEKLRIKAHKIIVDDNTWKFEFKRGNQRNLKVKYNYERGESEK